MKLEDQVVSLDLAKKLKELGVGQESIFYWDTIDEEIFMLEKNGPDISLPNYASAFTVAELGEMLPYEYWTQKYSNNHWCGCGGKPDQQKWNYSAATDNTEANARAKMLIHLIEKGVVKP